MVQFKRSVCPHDCPDTCGLLVGIENDRIVSLKGDPEHPFTRGATIVVIDPYRNRTAEKADLHLKPRPGTDAALALGIMHIPDMGSSCAFHCSLIEIEPL